MTTTLFASDFHATSLADSPLAGASWIWLPEHDLSDTYACFRRMFTLDGKEEHGFLDISVDTDFVAFLNGHEIGRGQFSDFPQRKTWSRIAIPSALLERKNVLAVAVHYRGTNSFDHQKGRAGLIAGLQIGNLRISSDQAWKGRQHPAFRSGHCEWVTAQTGLTFFFDARRDERMWTAVSYEDDCWAKVAIIQRKATEGYWHQLLPRPLPPLTLGEMPEVKVAFQGALISGDAAESVAQSMANTALRAELPWFVFENPSLGPSFPGSATIDEASIKTPTNAYGDAPLNAGYFLSGDSSEPLVIRHLRGNADGQFLMIDLMSETVGLLELEVEADEGTVLDIAYGEHLDDGRVRMKIGQRNFADRYICSGGRQHFQMPFRRIAARYLEIHCFSTGRLMIHKIGLRPVEYPTERKGSFRVNDPLAMKVHETAVRTLELCRHEHYEDCPWREQALYGYDSRLQALYGYYAFGDYRFPEVSFGMLHETLKESGFLGLIAPGDYPATIPSFSFAWIAAVAEHWLYSGSDILYRRVGSAVKKIIASALSRYDDESGLYFLPEGNGFWHFYEWTAGLAGEGGASAHHAAYHLHLHEALRCTIWLLKQSREESSARPLEAKLTALGKAIHRNFWDADTGIYRTLKERSGRLCGHHELVQALALHEDIVPEPYRAPLIGRIMEGNLRPSTLSASHYLMLPMLSHSAESRNWVMQRLGGSYEMMVLRGATSLWETAAGGADFDYAGSLCHGWSAQPVYLHQASVLGVTPIEPGFLRFSVQIYPSRHMLAEGVIPTPFGSIAVQWQKERTGLSIQISAPPECQPVFAPYPEAPYVEVVLNGKSLLN